MKKILVIDYDQGSLASLKGILIEEGYQVVIAGDGQAGWEKFNRESPDLVLLEAMLPKVHGFELCQRITSERNSQTPVFIMTGVYKDRVYRTEALRTYGAAEYFEKPLKMAELMSSIEAVLGKPEKKPAAEPAPAAPAKAARPEPVPAAPRKIDKPKPAEEEFAWSADLEKLRREMPKTTVREPSRHEPSLEARLDTITSELMKSAEAEPHLKAGEENPQELAEHKGNGNGNGNVDIDQFLKSALAGLDLNKEKVKVPKTAPLPPPPPAEKPSPVPPPVIFKPKPTPPPPPAVAEKPAAERPRPAPVAPPAAAFSRPAEPPAPSITLTPGDPGSDSSPFFTPEKKKIETPVERPRTPMPPPSPKQPKPQEKAAPIQPAAKPREAEFISSSEIFSEISADKPKKAFSPILAVGAGVAIIAVVGFFILRPKRPAAPAEDGLKPIQTVTQSNVAVTPAEEVPPPEVKPKPAAPKPKVETQTSVADIGPSSEDAILLPITPAKTLSGIGKPAGTVNSQGQNAAGSQAIKVDPPPAKTEGSVPPAKTEGTPAQPAAGDAGTTANPATPAALPLKPPANEGDLVDLGSVAEPPVTLKTVDPVYPPSAVRLGVEGSITVNALIDENGNVIDTGILKGLQDDKGLGKAAETAVRKWKFQPAKKDGVSVKVWKPFTIVFKAAVKIG
ncbi:MAG: TonB family protein, partial [Candidatus Aminicenantes bacterium]|nr:TonB family protein [Candidatus Aminicenantes bacterium]